MQGHRVPYIAMIVTILIVVTYLLYIYAYLPTKYNKYNEYNKYTTPKWAHLSYWKAHLVDQPDQVYELTAGGYDSAVQLAVQRLESRSTATDHARAAVMLHNSIRQHYDTTAREAKDCDHIALAEARALTLDRTRRHYLAAVQGRHAFLKNQDAQNNRQYSQQREAARGTGLADIALQFAHEGFALLANNDPAAAAALIQRRDVREADTADVREVDTILADAASKNRSDEIQLNIETATVLRPAETFGSSARSDAYIDAAIAHTSDSQNSHDSSVNAFKLATVTRLREDQGKTSLPTLDEITAEVLNSHAVLSRHPVSGAARSALTEKAVGTIERARKNEWSVSSDATDGEVLRRVWARMQDSRNSTNSSHIRQAIYDALVDCWAPGMSGENLQCVDGRIARITGALVLLDFDDRSNSLQRVEDHKNTIFEITRKSVSACAQAAAFQSDDLALRAVGLASLATSARDLAAAGPLDGVVEEKFVSDTRAKAEVLIDEYISSLDVGSLPTYLVPELKIEALAAITC
jgi:hypothetical protein